MTGCLAVLFDLDGTLFDRDATIGHLLEHQHVAFASQLAGVSREAFVAEAASLDEHGYRAKSEVYSHVCRKFGLPVSLVPVLSADFRARYHQHCQPNPGLIETLQDLRRRGKRLGIITNGTSAVQDGVIDALSIRRLMNVILVSEKEGVRKPSPEIFLRAASRIGAHPAECCYVGDNPDVDVAGARAARFQAVWKRTAYWPSPMGAVPAINSLPELLSLV